MAVEYFLKFEGPELKGESTAKGFEKQLQIESFSFGAARSGGMRRASGDGGSVGTAEAVDLNVIKLLDNSSPLLYINLCNGQHFDKVTLTARKSTGSGGQQVFFTAEMGKVLISNISFSGAAQGDIPTEALSLNFASIKFVYKTQNANGAVVDGNTAKYDFKTVEHS